MIKIDDGKVIKIEFTPLALTLQTVKFVPLKSVLKKSKPKPDKQTNDNFSAKINKAILSPILQNLNEKSVLDFPFRLHNFSL